MAGMAIVAGLMLSKSVAVLWLIGKSLDATDGKEGDERAVPMRRAFWLGVQEVVWFFGVCTAFSAIN